MKRLLPLVVLGLLFVANVFSSEAYADETITSRSAEIHGAKLHYLMAGHGPTLILLHGYAETSLMWRPIIPALAHRVTLVRQRRR